MVAHSPAGHPPYHGGEGTSAWFATQYIHNHLPDISPHDLVQLVASVGQETHGKYTYQSVVNAAHQGTAMPLAKNWQSRVHEVIVAADRHGRKRWVRGFGYTTKDIPGTGGPSNLEKFSGGALHDLSGTGHALGEAGSGVGNLFGGIGGLISSPILILVVIVVLVIVLKK